MSYGAITDNANVLKIMYPGKTVDTMIQEKIEFRKRLIRGLPPGAKLGEGYEIRMGARLAPAQNVAQIADTGNFPIPKEATDRQFVFKPSIFAGCYQIGGLSRFVASNNTVSFNGGDSRRKPEEVMSNMGKLIESTYVGTDGTGIRGYVEADGSNTIQVKAPWGLRLLPKNAYISVRIAAGSTVRDSIDLRQITDRNMDTRYLTYSGADQTAVADDPIYIVPESALTGAVLAAVHANGLRGQVDDGTLAGGLIHTLDRTAAGNSELKSVVDSNGGERRNLTEQLLIANNHKVGALSEKRPSTLVMGEGQVEKYVEFVAPQRRWNVTGRGRQGKTTGYKPEELVHSAPDVDMDFLVSYDCLPGEVYGVSWDSFFFYSAVDAQWMTGDEMSLHLLPGSNGASHRFAWGAYLVSVENWGTDFPLAHFKIKDLKDRLLGD